MTLEVPHRRKRHHLVGVEKHLLVCLSIGGQCQVSVRVDQPRQHGAGGEMLDLRVGQLLLEFAGGPERDDAGVVDSQRAVLDHAPAG